jgi:hypothetical protein
MNLKRLALLLSLCSLALIVTGCEWMRWLRLLSLKKQLAQLERYVRVDDTNGLTIHFLKPVVYADDLRLLMDEETQCTTNGNRQTWLWTYEKQSLVPQKNNGEFDLSFSASFDRLKFSELFFPDRFLAVLPKPLILGMLRSIGQADVDMKHGTVKFKWVGNPKEKIELPTMPQVTRLLGPPFTVTETNLTRTFLYKYYQKTSTPEPPAERLAWARFTCTNDSDHILSSQGCIGNMGWTMNSAPGQTEMHISVSLVGLNVEPVSLKLPPQVTDEYVGDYLTSTGAVLKIGRDGDAIVASWSGEGHGGWWSLGAESTNTLFGLPTGDPSYVFQRDNGGAVTGLVAHVNGSNKSFEKTTNPPAQTPPVIQLSPAAYESLTGTYKPSWGGRIFIRYDGGQLFWQNGGLRARVPLYPASETNFFFKAVDSPITFFKNDKGVVTKFALHYRGQTAEAEKVSRP